MFEARQVPNIGISIEGNPVLAAAWGRRWKAGRPTLINDEERGLKWVWALPQSWKWSDMKNLPRDLIDVEHAIKFWTENPEGELQASLPNGKTIKGVVIQGGISFLFDQKTYDEAVDTWLGFKQNQVLSHTKYLKDGTYLVKKMKAEAVFIKFGLSSLHSQEPFYVFRFLAPVESAQYYTVTRGILRRAPKKTVEKN